MMRGCLLMLLSAITAAAFAQNPGGVSSGLRAWYKANANVTSSGGGVVSAWNNQVSGGTHINNVAGAPALVAAGLNFNPTIKFSGTDYMATNSVAGSNFIAASNNTAFIVFTNGLPAATAGVMSKWENSTSNRISWEITNLGQLRLDYPRSGVGGSPSTNGMKVSTTTVNTFSYIGVGATNGSMDSLIINGLTNVVQASGTSDPTQTGRLQLGANWGGSYPFTGEISEIIYYNSHLLATDRRRVESYLAVKYGITLGSMTNPISYISSSTATIPWTGSSVYQNNVAGIGRDDNSGLNQKQSKSVNPNSLVTMSLGAIQATNTANTNTFLTDRSFLLWGDNNQSLSSAGVTDLPPGISSRVARIWRSQETGAVGVVRVKFDLAPTVMASYNMDYQYVRLLVDGDGVFATGATQILPVAYNNATNTVEFDVDFNAVTGFYFSLGSIDNTYASLPVTWLNFDAKMINNDVQLTWTTSYEKDVKNYYIEWSHDATNWIQEGIVAANNGSSSLNTYSYLDTKPHNGISYYRIRQTDIDGASSYSTIKNVYADRKANVVIDPIPADDYLYVSSESKMQFSITDLNGQFVCEGVVTEGETKRISVLNWRSGVYFINYQIEGNSPETEKIVVRH